MPQTDGRIVVAGPKAEIRVERDADGVPRIIAQDDEDLAFGLGFVHAQERLFQMELQRRYGAGRLSEIFGPQALAVDRQMRVLGLYRAAEAEIPFLSAAMKRALEAYAAGVNAFLKSRRGALPPEFLLLGFAPEPWRPADSLVWGKLMAVLLGGNYRGELLRARMARTISAADLAFLYPEYPQDAPTTLAEMVPIYRRLALDDLYGALPAVVGPNYASNNWVVDGRHSASGKPILANDPHLAFGAPGYWYLARLETPQHQITGATAAGVPLVVIGHNERIAWGFTTTTADVEDLFVEQVDPADPNRYRDAARERAVQITARDHHCEGQPRRSRLRSARPGMAQCCPTPCRRGQPSRDLSSPWRRPSRSPMTAAPRRCGRSTARPIGRAFGRHCVTSSGRCRTLSMPMSTARSASSRRGWCRSAGAGKAGCRRRAGPAAMIGSGLFHSRRCRALSIRHRATS